jgi:hypothetical protein
LRLAGVVDAPATLRAASLAHRRARSGEALTEEARHAAPTKDGAQVGADVGRESQSRDNPLKSLNRSSDSRPLRVVSF